MALKESSPNDLTNKMTTKTDKNIPKIDTNALKHILLNVVALFDLVVVRNHCRDNHIFIDDLPISERKKITADIVLNIVYSVDFDCIYVYCNPIVDDYMADEIRWFLTTSKIDYELSVEKMEGVTVYEITILNKEFYALFKVSEGEHSTTKSSWNKKHLN